MLVLMDFKTCERTQRRSLQTVHDGLKEAPLPQPCFDTGDAVKFCTWFSYPVLLHVSLYVFCDTFLQVGVWIYWWEFRYLCYLFNSSFCQKHYWLFVMLKTLGNSPFRTADKNSYYYCKEFIACLVL